MTKGEMVVCLRRCADEYSLKMSCTECPHFNVEYPKCRTMLLNEAARMLEEQLVEKRNVCVCRPSDDGC